MACCSARSLKLKKAATRKATAKANKLAKAGKKIPAKKVPAKKTPAKKVPACKPCGKGK